MENEKMEQRTFKDFLKDFWKENKLMILIGGGYAVTIGMYLWGVTAGAKAVQETTNVGEAILHRDGFLKFFDPSTGEEVNGVRATELVKEFYNLKK